AAVSGFVAPADSDGARLGFGASPAARGTEDLAPVPREEDPDVELVAAALDLLEEGPEAPALLLPTLPPAPHRLGQLGVGAVDVDLSAAGDPEQLLLVPLARRVPPGLDRAVGARGGGRPGHPALGVGQGVGGSRAPG